MNWLDFIFPYIESLDSDQAEEQQKLLEEDVAAISATKFRVEPQRALDEAQRAASLDSERARVAESKATTYLAVLAALVPIVITLQTATWEAKSGPAPDWLKLSLMLAATVYLAAAGYQAFRALQVSSFQCVMEPEIVAAWNKPRPLVELTRSTLLASRRSRDSVNAKVTRIKVTHAHLLRALAAFVLLLSLDPVFHLAGYSGKPTTRAPEQNSPCPPAPRLSPPPLGGVDKLVDARLDA